MKKVVVFRLTKLLLPSLPDVAGDDLRRTTQETLVLLLKIGCTLLLPSDPFTSMCSKCKDTAVTLACARLAATNKFTSKLPDSEQQNNVINFRFIICFLFILGDVQNNVCVAMHHR